MHFTREESLSRLRAVVERGEPIVGAGAGTGISAKFAERGGVDLLIIYNSGRYRMNGRGSLAGLLPYGDANEIVLEMGQEVLPVVEDTPVLAGVNGTDPFREMDVFITDLKRRGFSGVQNFPTVGLFDEESRFRRNIEETSMGYGKEIAMIQEAAEQGMLTCPYVFTREQAREMTEAGADVIVSHMGLTTSGDIGAETALSLEDAAERVQAHHDAAKAVDEDVLVICHGGPIAWPDDAEFVLENTDGVVGFFGASSVERLPTEEAIERQAQEFKEITI
ncbi:phosphoenolpyruvate hydrolase family protein [Natronococcus occultus]|uniref:Putative TIM-barrel enzyme, possibly a dioxygenase n=1 Tax=Natronococcus occultus SP4 TaxID=694430 RepID=L0K3F2_9EURY|nr:phosphoenolpyruvate hydrolase family protein [Natronococcus occultus]AGB38869.1 putative TIM-barrel enzyme, possibly a dioxygenase [Natronococcus occultus SP4]